MDEPIYFILKVLFDFALEVWFSISLQVYQHRSRNFGSSLVDGESEKDTAAGELTPDQFPQLANGTGPNRTRA